MSIYIRKSAKISPFYWLIILFLQPAFLAYQLGLEMLYDLWHYIQFAVVWLLLAGYVYYDKLQCRLLNYILLYYAWICISCLMNRYTPISIIWELFPDVGISLFAYKAMKRNLGRYLNTTSKILILYILINFFTMVLFPDGIASGRIGQKMWFLGNKNVIIPYIIVGGGMAVLCSYYRQEKNTVGTYVLILLLCLSTFITNSSTTILLSILFTAGVLIEILVKRRLLEKFLSGRNLFLLVAGIFLFVVFFSTNQSIVADITAWLGKDVTYNGRTALWASSITRIKSNPVFGIGPSLVLDVGWGVTMTHAHDLFLNIATKYGIPALVLLVVCLVHTFRQNKGAGTPLAWYALALYLVGSVVEVYSTNTLFLLCITLSIWGEKRNEVKANIPLRPV